MTHCPYCKGIVWPWQRRVFTLHRVCLEIFCQGYAQGVTVATKQAGEIIHDVLAQRINQAGSIKMQ